MAVHICGVYYVIPNPHVVGLVKLQYLPQVDLQAHTIILSTTSRTTLTQTFVNPSQSKGIKELRFTFPLYDGVSVVGFQCRIGDRTIIGEVKEKEKAKAVYKEAVARGETAGLLEQLLDASDVFTTTVGNVPPGASLVTEITYLGELKHDAEVDGIRFTIPTVIAPRYGDYPGDLARSAHNTQGKGIQITVDVEMPEKSFIQQMRSPSHPISVTMGNTSLAPKAEPKMTSASATLSLGSAELEKDFVLQVVSKDTGVPTAVLETHPTIPNQRALMATLVPKFSLPPERPEVVFICDRSGSMAGSKIPLVVSALKVFLKSLPLGVNFNICSFGSRHSFLWKKSKSYSQSSLDEAIKHVETFQADYGGTEMFAPIRATLELRYKDIPLEVMLLTDGEIWDQETLFSYLNKEVIESKAPIRVFTLGIGNGVSHALIEGIARAGNGFSQAVGEGEKLDSKVVRMLKGALSPHVTDYSLEVKYVDDNSSTIDDEFEIVEKAIDSLSIKTTEKETTKDEPKKPISLFDLSVNLDKEEPTPIDESGEARYAHLPTIATPSVLQAPQNIPPLFPFSRTSVYLLLGPSSVQKKPKSVVLRGTSAHGPLELEIPVQILDTPGETIHQLAAKKAIAELEQDRGWLTEARDEAQNLLKKKYESRFEDMVEREAVRLGVQYQVGGKWCSFVAVESNKADESASDDSTLVNVEWLDVPSTISSHRVPQPESSALFGGMDKIKARMASPSSRFGGAVQAASIQAPGGGLFGSARSSSARTGSPSLFGAPGAPPAPPAPSSPFGVTQQTSFASCGAAPPQQRKSAASDNVFLAQNLGSVMQRGERLDSLVDKSDSLSSNSRMFSKEAKKQPSLFGSVFGNSSSSTPKPSSAAPSLFGSSSGKSYKPSSAAPSLFGSSSSNSFKPFSAAPAFFGSQSVQEFNPASSPPRPKLDTLVELQTFEGFWEWTDALFAVIGISKEHTVKLATMYSQRTVATALAVAFFEKKLASEKDAWELVVEKAKGWLEVELGAVPVEDVVEAAGRVII